MYAKRHDLIASGVVAINLLLLPILLPNVTAQVCWLQQIYSANSDEGSIVLYNTNEIDCVQLCTSLGGSCQAVDYDVTHRNCYTHTYTNFTLPSSCCVRYHYTCGYTRTCTSDSFETATGWTSENRDRLGIVQPAVRTEAQCQNLCLTNVANCTRAITYRLNATHRACLLYTTLNDSFTTSTNDEKVHMRKFCKSIPANVSLPSSSTTTTTTTTATTSPLSTATSMESLSTATTTTTVDGLTTPSTITTPSSTTTSSGKPRTAGPSITILSSSTESAAIPASVSSIWPLYGPVAGGTRMTISGHLINRLTVRAVMIGSYRLLPDGSNSTNSISADFITVVTPGVNETLQGHLPIAVELSDGFILSTNISFDYRDNPNLVDIQPRKHLLVGGTQLTVTGSSLDSVANPSITVTVVVTRFNNVTTMSQSTIDGRCWFPDDADADGYEMLCRMPPVELPADFDPQQNTSIMNISETSGVAVYYGPNGRDRADVYVGLHLDGLTSYSNISAVKPDIKMEYYSKPTISCHAKESTFNPQKDNVIVVKGSNLARGSRLVDFSITIGIGLCENVDLTDNQVTCRPPKKRPPTNRNNSSFCNDQLFTVELWIGNAYYHCSCLRYDDSDNVLLILGLTVGLGVPLLLLIIALVACRIHSTTDSWDATGQKVQKGQKRDDDDDDDDDAKSKTYQEEHSRELNDSWDATGQKAEKAQKRDDDDDDDDDAKSKTYQEEHATELNDSWDMTGQKAEKAQKRDDDDDDDAKSKTYQEEHARELNDYRL